MIKKNKETNKKEELIKQFDEETDQIKTFIFILVGVAIVAVALYFLSSKVLVKDGVRPSEETSEEEIAYNNVNVGNVFNRPYDEYYVFAFDSTTVKANYYSALLNSFDTTKTQVYFLDLGVDINKAYVKETSNSKATKASELALKEPTLMYIKDGKITKYVETVDDIVKEIG